MIPLPPGDAALPALEAALDALAARELLAGQLAEGFELLDCRPYYIRYKPQTSCLVQYRLGLRELETDCTLEVLAQATLYAGRRAERLWSKGSLQRLAATAARWHPDPPLARVAYLPGLGAVLQLYPVDLKLPALALAASARGGQRVLRHAPSRAREGGVELVRYKPARKALLRYGSVYAKLYADERGELVRHASRALAAAGVTTPAPLAYLPSLRALLLPEAAGRRVTAPEELAAAGEELARVHATPVAGLPVHTWEHETAALLAAARAIGVLRPDLAREAASLSEGVAEHLRALPAVPVTAHGDFYDDQVLVSDGRVVLLDLDRIRAMHPLVDVGNFLAHLSVDGATGPARAAFLEGYAASVDEVPLFESAALLRLAVEPFRRLEPDWPEGLESRVRLAAQKLEDHRRDRSSARPPANGRMRDPALPQLAALVNPLVLADALERDVYGEPVDVTAVTIVRHKPGRRCTLRYDLRVGAGRRAERLYAKTFASERGPRVYRALRTIAGAHACGPGVALPDPVAYLTRLKLLLQREVEGVPAREALLAGDEPLAARIAEALHALHSSGAALERRHELADELGALRERVGTLAAYRAGARRCLARLERESSGSFEWRWRPVHRDFYHDQVLVSGRGLALLDFDDAAMSEPAVDVANFLAHLRLLALQEPGRAEALRAAAAAFRARYRQLDGHLDPGLVRLLESATLLRLACIHEQLAESLVAESGRLAA